jgi:hypothetical protein
MRRPQTSMFNQGPLDRLQVIIEVELFSKCLSSHPAEMRGFGDREFSHLS